jgi:hypothetical protein
MMDDQPVAELHELKCRYDRLEPLPGGWESPRTLFRCILGRGSPVAVQGILDNGGAGCSAEQVATEIYDLPLDVVRRVFVFCP